MNSFLLSASTQEITTASVFRKFQQTNRKHHQLGLDHRHVRHCPNRPSTHKAGVISVIPPAIPLTNTNSSTFSPQRTLPQPPPPLTQPTSANEYSSVQSSPSSNHSSPSSEPKTIPTTLPPIQNVSLKDNDPANAIYEEINDDVVSITMLFCTCYWIVSTILSPDNTNFQIENFAVHTKT